jgi:hypothetical protein
VLLDSMNPYEFAELPVTAHENQGEAL